MSFIHFNILIVFLVLPVLLHVYHIAVYDIKNKIEIEEKDRSILMFNHPESTKTNSSERKKDDIEFVHSSNFRTTSSVLFQTWLIYLK